MWFVLSNLVISLGWGGVGELVLEEAMWVKGLGGVVVLRFVRGFRFWV